MWVKEKCTNYDWYDLKLKDSTGEWQTVRECCNYNSPTLVFDGTINAKTMNDDREQHEDFENTKESRQHGIKGIIVHACKGIIIHGINNAIFNLTSIQSHGNKEQESQNEAQNDSD